MDLAGLHLRSWGVYVRWTQWRHRHAHISYMQDYHSNKHIDHQLELAHQRKDWPVYCPVKWICGQRAGTSNISGKDNPDQIWQ